MIRNIVPLSSFVIFFFLFLNTHAAEANWKPAKNGDKIILKPLNIVVGGVPIFGIPKAIFPHSNEERRSVSFNLRLLPKDLKSPVIEGK